MAVVDVIDLTSSSPPRSPPRILIDDDNIKEPALTMSNGGTEEKKKKRKRRHKDERDRYARRKHDEDQTHEDSWKHDRFLDEDRLRRGEKRKWDDDRDDSRQSRRRERSSTPPPLFMIDTSRSTVVGGPIPIPIVLPRVVDVTVEPVANPGPVEQGLLLPAHVTLPAQDSASIPSDYPPPPLSPVSEASGIDFLDDDRAVGAPRYFDEKAINPKAARSRGPCKRCGDDDHELKSCPNMICLTCGARNEHNPRSCPILRFCWNCKGKGHIARDCPRIGNMDPQRLDRQDCERCGSWKHHGTNCPTIWRIYTYLADAERDTVLADRESQRQLGFDAGGEGYIARDQWCYNCGGSGHLGDDCETTAPNHDRPNDYSAFGSYNLFTGPFASPTSIIPDIQRTPREWEQGDRFDDGHGFAAENNVGRKGRENAKAKAREAQRLADDEDDEPDWFNRNRANGNGRGKVTPGPPSRPNGNPNGRGGLPSKPLPPIINFGVHKSSSSSSRTPWDSVPPLNAPRAPKARPSEPIPPSRPSLRARIDTGDVPGSGGSRSDRGKKSSRDRDRRRDGDEKRSRDGGGTRDRERDGGRTGGHSRRDEARRERGSRWRGGYDR